MNIFLLAPSPQASAQAQCDKHIVKMPTETAQMVSTALRVAFPKRTENNTTLYKVSYQNHPCNLWARRSIGNLAWLIHHGRALCGEYSLRYGKIHAAERVLKHALDLLEDIPVSETLAAGLKLASPSRFPLCMPDQYKEYVEIDENGCAHVTQEAIHAYRRFYKGEKARFATWKPPTKPPAWWAVEGDVWDGA